MTEGLYRKLYHAREARAIVVTTPTAIKSFALKFVEIMHTLDSASIATENTKRKQSHQAARPSQQLHASFCHDGAGLASRLRALCGADPPSFHACPSRPLTPSLLM